MPLCVPKTFDSKATAAIIVLFLALVDPSFAVKNNRANFVILNDICYTQAEVFNALGNAATLKYSQAFVTHSASRHFSPALYGAPLAFQ